MKYSLDEHEIPTLKSALAGYTVDNLKRLASLTGEKPPMRKVDIAAVIVRYLQGQRLHTVWQGLDELQQAAVAEVVHADSAWFDAARFRASTEKIHTGARKTGTAATAGTRHYVSSSTDPTDA